MNDIIGKGIAEHLYFSFYFNWGFYFSAGYLFCYKIYESFFNELKISLKCPAAA